MVQACFNDATTWHQRCEAWDAHLRSVCGEFVTEFCAESRDFRGSIQVESSAGLEFMQLEQNALAIKRGRRQISQSDDRNYFLIFQLSGSSVMVQGDEAAELGPGDLTLIDSGQPSAFHFGATNTQLSLPIPREFLSVRHDLSWYARKIAGHSGIGSVISRYVLGLYENRHVANELNVTESQSTRQALFSLVQALAVSQDTAGYAGCTSIVTSHLPILRQRIDARLHDPELTPVRIAEMYGISIRHLHRIFATSDQSVGEWLRMQRLEKCQSDLANPNLKRLSVTDIAFRWGFNDSSHFSRAFKSAFGLAPKEYRQQAFLSLRNDPVQ